MKTVSNNNRAYLYRSGTRTSGNLGDKRFTYWRRFKSKLFITRQSILNTPKKRVSDGNCSYIYTNNEEGN